MNSASLGSKFGLKSCKTLLRQKQRRHVSLAFCAQPQKGSNKVCGSPFLLFKQNFHL